MQTVGNEWVARPIARLRRSGISAGAQGRLGSDRAENVLDCRSPMPYTYPGHHEAVSSRRSEDYLNEDEESEAEAVSGLGCFCGGYFDGVTNAC